MNNTLSSVAIVLSSLALLLGGFSAYQVINLQNKVENLAAAPSSSPTASNPTIAPAPVPTDNSSRDASPTAASSAIQPGQFVQPAFNNKGQVELLSVKRIEYPDFPGQKVVNVQFRVRRVSENAVGSDSLTPGATTARNPETNETYSAVDLIKRATSTIVLPTVKPNASVDAYVWMKIPEGVNTVNLYIENTQAFSNVPIEN